MSHWRQQVESFIRGRRWIVAHDVAQATAKGMQRVMDLGAQDVLGIATSMGTGDLAPHDPDKLVVLVASCRQVSRRCRRSRAFPCDRLRIPWS